MTQHVMQLFHPDISKDMCDQINLIIDKYRLKPGSVIPVLRECQNVVGYLPPQLIDYIGRGLNVSPSDVYGVASFYALFSFEPKGKHTIKVCKGTACYVKGIKEVIERISSDLNLQEGKTSTDRKFSLQTVRCLGACGLAPVIVIDEDIHGNISANQAVSILEKYK